MRHDFWAGSDPALPWPAGLCLFLLWQDGFQKSPALRGSIGPQGHEERTIMSNEAVSADQRGAGTDSTPGNIASYIDHTLLRPDASQAEILKVCAEAAEYHFKSVCVNPLWVKTVKTALKGSGVLTCSVIGFPLGATPTDVKTFEARGAVLDGADEIDMVINIAAARAGDKGAVVEDISAVAEAVHASGAILKVIIETVFLSDDQKVLACQAAVEAGADFVKTSTGFNGGGATAEDIALMRRTVGPELGVKASGGVRSLADAQAMIAAGATRIGASSGIAIVKGEQGSAGY
jgi:deoxyribose-phosphate aldolase